LRRAALLLALLAVAPLAAAGPFDDVNAALSGAGAPVTVGPLPAAPSPPPLPGVPDPFPPAPEEQASCGGTAPLMTTCDASLTGLEGQSVTIWIELGTPFLGTAVAVVRDTDGNSVTVTCVTNPVYVAGVILATCDVQHNGDLHAGTLSLHGETRDVTVGFWEVHAETQ
jgi:hypothetical protein